MNRKTAVAVLVGLVVGVAGTLGINAATKNNQQATKSTAGQPLTNAVDHNLQTTVKLKDLQGDEFDKAFIEEMIIHHQGAIEMAELTAKNAKHDEIKQLGQDIISAQSKEIDTMKSWQVDWGYKMSPQPHDKHNM